MGWFRKGFMMVLVYRPPMGSTDETGQPVEDNETHIIVQKARPKGVGQTGTRTLYFDKPKNRYYQQTRDGISYAKKGNKQKKIKSFDKQS